MTTGNGDLGSSASCVGRARMMIAAIRASRQHAGRDPRDAQPAGQGMAKDDSGASDTTYQRKRDNSGERNRRPRGRTGRAVTGRTLAGWLRAG
jgi:hypothetical protein